MIGTVLQQLNRIAAILALALLCAQTLVVVHDHQISENELCAVCSTTVEHADTTSRIPSDTEWTSYAALAAPVPVAPAQAFQPTYPARAPPIA